MNKLTFFKGALSTPRAPVVWRGLLIDYYDVFKPSGC